VQAERAEKYLVVFVTTASEEDAARIAGELVRENLAACGNVIGRIRSIYTWRGKVEDDAEALLILKTRAALFDRLRERVVELHGYDVPEVLALPVEAGHRPYLDWIGENTSG
jgi:periplasmic divalent cation tolerance protein